MSYSKETYRTGNFVYFNKKLHLIFKQIDSIIGNVLYLVSCENQLQIHIVHEKNVQAYTRKPNGQKSASNMTEKQRICIECIEKTLKIKFNGRTLSDVSLFIQQFAPTSQYKNHYDEEKNRELYDGLTLEDLMGI